MATAAVALRQLMKPKRRASLLETVFSKNYRNGVDGTLARVEHRLSLLQNEIDKLRVENEKIRAALSHEIEKSTVQPRLDLDLANKPLPKGTDELFAGTKRLREKINRILVHDPRVYRCINIGNAFLLAGFTLELVLVVEDRKATMRNQRKVALSDKNDNSSI